MVTSWTQTYITDFLAHIGGLFTSVIAGASFLLTNYQHFVSEKSLLKRLYGEDLSLSGASSAGEENQQVDEAESPVDG